MHKNYKKTQVSLNVNRKPSFYVYLQDSLPCISMFLGIWSLFLFLHDLLLRNVEAVSALLIPLML